MYRSFSVLALLLAVSLGFVTCVMPATAQDNYSGSYGNSDPAASNLYAQPPYAQAPQQYSNSQGQQYQQTPQQGAFAQQQYGGQQQYPNQQYGGDPNQYGQQAPQQSTYYGYAADVTQQQQQAGQAPAQQGYAQQQPQYPQQYPPQQAQQPVYGTQGAPSATAQQPGNLQQFLDNSDQQQQQKPESNSGGGGPSKLAQAGGTLAKVAGSMATGYLMGKAMQRQQRNMGMGGYGGMPMGGYGMPMGGYGGYGMNNGYGMPMGGYGMNNGYGMPMGGYGMNNGYGMPMGGMASPLGASVMSGLNSLMHH